MFIHLSILSFRMLALFFVFQCSPSTSFAQFLGFVQFEGTTTGMGGVNVFLDPADPNTDPCDETTNFLGGFACSNFISAGSITADVTIPGTGPGGSFTFDDWDDGVTTFDLVLITRHILNTQPLENGYRLLAADVNGDTAITTGLDIIPLRKLILNIELPPPVLDSLDNPIAGLDKPWRWVPEYLPFGNPTFFANSTGTQTPFTVGGYPYYLATNWSFNVFASNTLDNGFDGVKVGDVSGNNSHSNGFAGNETTDRSVLMNFSTPTDFIEEGTVFHLIFRTDNFRDIVGYQMGFNLSALDVEVLGVEPGDLPGFSPDNFGLTRLGQDEFRTLWIDPEGKSRSLEEGQSLFTLRLKATKPIFDFSRVISRSDEILQNEFYHPEGNLAEAGIYLDIQKQASGLVGNHPNPFTNETSLTFELEEPSAAVVTIYDTQGKVLRTWREFFEGGYNEFTITDFEGLANGIIFFIVATDTQLFSGKMIKVD